MLQGPTRVVDGTGGQHFYVGNEHGLVTRYIAPLGRETRYSRRLRAGFYKSRAP